jgi:hypothetical protein
MKKKIRNPEEYVIYEGIGDIDVSNIDLGDFNNLDENLGLKSYHKESNHQFPDRDRFETHFNHGTDVNLQNEIDSFLKAEEDNRKSDSFEEIYDTLMPGYDTDDIRKQRNFQDFIELNYTCRAPKGYTDSSRIPASYVEHSKDSIEIHDNPTKSTGTNKHRPTVLIIKDEDEVVTGIQFICSCGEKTNISFDYEENEFNTQSEYEELSPQAQS